MRKNGQVQIKGMCVCVCALVTGPESWLAVYGISKAEHPIYQFMSGCVALQHPVSTGLCHVASSVNGHVNSVLLPLPLLLLPLLLHPATTQLPKATTANYYYHCCR